MQAVASPKTVSLAKDRVLFGIIITQILRFVNIPLELVEVSRGFFICLKGGVYMSDMDILDVCSAVSDRLIVLSVLLSDADCIHSSLFNVLSGSSGADAVRDLVSDNLVDLSKQLSSLADR